MKRIVNGIGFLIATVNVFAQQPAPVAAQPGMVEWLVPALGTHAPQTEQEAEAGRQRGRKPPAPEVLQPGLDPALPAYSPRKDIHLRGSFKAAASDVLPELVRLWVAKFSHYYPDVEIALSPPYAGSLGAKELVQQKIDFVFVSRELKPDDIADFKVKFGYEPLSVPISGGSYRHFGFLDAVAFFVNKDNPLETITFDQIDAMFSATRHRGGEAAVTWGDLGLMGEWADKPIHVYGIKPWNGFEEFVRQRVLSRGGKRGEWREDITFEKLVFPMARDVARDRYGVAYSGLAFIDAGVKILPIAETAGGPFRAPTYEEVALASYPLSRLIYFNTSKAPQKPLNPAVEEFLRFVLSKEGQQVVLEHAIYLPLRARQVQAARALLGQ